MACLHAHPITHARISVIVIVGSHACNYPNSAILLAYCLQPALARFLQPPRRPCQCVQRPASPMQAAHRLGWADSGADRSHTWHHHLADLPRQQPSEILHLESDWDGYIAPA
jgi:hypothetical protein